MYIYMSKQVLQPFIAFCFGSGCGTELVLGVVPSRKGFSKVSDSSAAHAPNLDSLDWATCLNDKGPTLMKCCYSEFLSWNSRGTIPGL